MDVTYYVEKGTTAGCINNVTLSDSLDIPDEPDGKENEPHDSNPPPNQWYSRLSHFGGTYYINY